MRGRLAHAPLVISLGDGRYSICENGSTLETWPGTIFHLRHSNWAGDSLRKRDVKLTVRRPQVKEKSRPLVSRTT